MKVNRVTGLSNDIQYAMASLDVRILAPIPGRSAVGVEVPNKERIIVTLGDVLAAPEVAKSKTALGVGLGRDISGKSVMLDVTTLARTCSSRARPERARAAASTRSSRRC